MKNIILLISIILIPYGLAGQRSGFGYTLDFGGSPWSQRTADYNQLMGAYTHNAFIRTHSESGNSACQFNVGYKAEYTAFQNYSDFVSSDGSGMLSYSTDAIIDRKSWKFGMLEHYQFGSPPGGPVLFSVNAGIFYEHTVSARRHSNSDDIRYNLIGELNPHGFGYTVGTELRFYFVTLGYKVEQLFRDVLDHETILSQELSIGNSSELRGLMMHPLMHYFYVGVNFDAFRKGTD
ncbi:MAG: hypothetical protein JW801_15810 [Bacteroidales bacterium]|nr:hypothetical protein [Bacteroidales bacterium]